MAKPEINRSPQFGEIEGRFPVQPPLELLREIVAWLQTGAEVYRSESVNFPVLNERMQPEEALDALLRRDSSSLISAPLASIAYSKNCDPELRLFEGLFGRDSLRISSFLLRSHPEIVKVTLKELAALQGRVFNQSREEERGKIIHEHRIAGDPIREKLEAGGWGFPYYGAIDSTPLFITLLKDYLEYTQTDIMSERLTIAGEVVQLADVVVSALEWICAKMDESKSYLLEFKRLNPSGILNQAWKDSLDSYHHKDGVIANHAQGIASVEVQALAYDALLAGDYLLKVLKKKKIAGALSLQDRAAAIRQSVLENFWHEEKGQGYFVLGTDRDEQGDLRQLQIKTSNMGHLLDSRILEGDDRRVSACRAAMIETLFSAELLSPAGIRTLASDEKRFNPFAYHNGSVWPWDNAVIARGLRRHGEIEKARILEEKIMSIWKQTKLFPEFVVGDSRQEVRMNTMIVDIVGTDYPNRHRLAQPPQPVQGWTVAAVIMARDALKL